MKSDFKETKNILADNIPAWHSSPLDKLLIQIGANSQNGLDGQEVKKRREAWGKNILPEGKKTTAAEMFFRQFTSPLVYILLIAAVLTWWIKEYADMTVILVVVLVNALVGLFQEYRANQIFEKLKQIVKIRSLVIRDGLLTELDAEELLPGDIIVLKAGNKIPADARLIEVGNLETNEALLTGESKSVHKSLETAPVKALIGDRTNMVFMGTVIERGEGRAVVVTTGARTEIGQISTLTQSTTDEQSPLQIRMQKLGRMLSELFLVISMAVFVIGLLEGDDLIEMAKTTIAMAVAAIPEGLPAAISIILAVSSQKILEKKGLVRKLIAAETLGSTSVICSDKTGTLTYGEMRIEQLFSGNEKQTLLSMALANEAILEIKDGKQIVSGEATDRAKLEKFLNTPGSDLEQTKIDLPRLALLPFDESRKYLASFHKDKNKLHIFVSGAPETLISFSRLSAEETVLIKKTCDDLAQRGFRVIAAAEKIMDLTKPTLSWTIESMTSLIGDLTYLGLAALRDPIRKDVRSTIELTKLAGIKVLMITGDHVLTAKAIGLELGFSISAEAVISGEELDQLTDSQLAKRISRLEILARVTPVHKMRIIKAWQKLGAVVAMTGDGVNDAPALKAADIGVAVGTGTDVAKEASDLVLLDDSFTTITAAITQGRTGFANIRKATVTVMSNAFTEITLITSTLVFHTPFPITAIQILWVNLALDSLPVLAMAFEPAEEEIMKSKPTSPKEPILDKESKSLIFAVSIFADLTLVGIFLYLLKILEWDLVKIQSFIFVATATPTLFNVFAFKSFKTPLFRIKILNNRFLIGSVIFGMILMILAIYLPFFNDFLKTVPLNFGPALLAFLIFPAYKLGLVELTKWWFNRKPR